MLVRDPQLADNAVGSGPAAGSPHVSWTMSGRTRSAVVGFQAISFHRVSNDPVGCERDKVLDLVFGDLFSKDSDPRYKAVSLRSYASLDNDLSLSCCPS